MPLSILILSLGSYIYNNKSLEVSNLFTANNLIQNMTSPLMSIPLFLNEFFSNLISINRIQNFLYQQEHENSNKYQNNEKLIKDNILIKYKNVSVLKNETSDNYNNDNINNNNDVLLTDINFEIKKGEFIIILGSTGSGKTALINSILNNYTFNDDKNVTINGNISYTPQTSWIMNETIRNNIIFFNEFNKERYSKILTVCNLIYDLEKLPNGDLTKLLSNGSNISGGQRARINLARSLYKNADLYLLDDPLANIDSKVGNEIFNMAFLDFLKDKAKILITNELNGISSADKIIVLDEGKIKFMGNFNEFQKDLNISKYEFRKVNNIKTKDKNKKNDNNKNKNKKENNNDSNTKNDDKKLKIEKAKDIITISDKKLLELTDKNNEILKKPKKEDISLHTYYTYIKLQGGYLVFIILLSCIIGARYFDSYRRIYITSFSKTAKEINTNDINNKKFDIVNNENIISSQQQFNFNNYLIISFFGILLNFIVEFIITQSTIYSLRTLHETMIIKLLRAPINLFHDIVSIGQILNRLTKDVEIVQLIINRVTIFLKSFALLASCIYICFYYNKYSIILSPVLLFFSLLLTIYYLSAARNMEHLHRTTFSPILTILNESIRGVELIRNFNNEENIKNKIYKRLDDHYGVHLYTEGCKRWYYQRLRFLTHIFNTVMIMIIIYKHDLFSTQAIGLILQYTEELSWELATFLGFFSQIEISLISLERCEKVTKIIEEKDNDKFRENDNNNNKDKKWPNKGEIEVKNYSLKYRPGLPVILKNINIHIKPKEKIGLVGRTGSGKSSLVLGISRIVEANKGTITIDNIDIKDVNLDYLRHNICIIPQDTFLFEGTVKENIDPENKNNDNDIINILNEFGILKHLNDNNNDKLNFYIKENGSNLSLGEKQLICFARVFLKNSKIIILDEATSSLDSSTENIIKKKLNNCEATLIIIAHHISMVKECEKIIVLDKGEIVEFDTYDNLLKNKKSKFYELYNESLIS